MKIKKLFDNKFYLAEEFLQKNFSSPTHWPDWNKVVSKYYQTDFFYFAGYENNDIVGICPVHKVKGKYVSNLFSGQFHYIPNGGWILKNGSYSNNLKLPLNPNESFHCNALPSIEQFGFAYNNVKSNALTLIINLNKEDDHIYNNDIHSKRRNMIRKALKSNVEIVKMKKEELPVFYDLYTKANKRYNLTSYPYELFKELVYESRNIFFEIMFAKMQGEIHKVIVNAYDKDYAFYWLGFGAENIPNSGQGDLLQWEAIKLMKSKGCKIYDLCYIEKERLPHIYKFKKGFSKCEVKIPIVNQKPLSYKVINKITKCF